jgi:hypothetical protein
MNKIQTLKESLLPLKQGMLSDSSLRSRHNLGLLSEQTSSMLSKSSILKNLENEEDSKDTES